MLGNFNSDPTEEAMKTAKQSAKYTILKTY